MSPPKCRCPIETRILHRADCAAGKTIAIQDAADLIGNIFIPEEDAKHTPGPWALRGTQIRARSGLGVHVATYQIHAADGRLIAAAPELLSLLINACESLDAAESGASEHGTARDVRARLAELGLPYLA